MPGVHPFQECGYRGDPQQGNPLLDAAISQLSLPRRSIGAQAAAVFKKALRRWRFWWWRCLLSMVRGGLVDYDSTILGARNMRCYWRILAAIALWLLPLQVIAEQRP